jgi:hypothetical protein
MNKEKKEEMKDIGGNIMEKILVVIVLLILTSVLIVTKILPMFENVQDVSDKSHNIISNTHNNLEEE